jgi:hypothetical protein
VKASTCSGDDIDEANAKGYYETHLADAFTTSLCIASGFGLTKKVDSIAASKILFLFQSAYVLRMKKPGWNRSETHISYGETRNTFGASDRYYTKSCERKVVALSKDAHTRMCHTCTCVDIVEHLAFLAKSCSKPFVLINSPLDHIHLDSHPG